MLQQNYIKANWDLSLFKSWLFQATDHKLQIGSKSMSVTQIYMNCEKTVPLPAVQSSVHMVHRLYQLWKDLHPGTD